MKREGRVPREDEGACDVSEKEEQQLQMRDSALNSPYSKLGWLLAACRDP
jgi:hypothetical protein